MATLTIDIKYLTLFAHYKSGLIVLLPSDGHNAWIRKGDTGKKYFLAQEDIELLQDGRPVWGSATAPASSKRVVPLEAIAGVAALNPKATLLADACPAELNARLFLAGGKVKALRPDSFPNLEKVIWRFRDAESNKTVRSQTLTDTAQFRLSLRSGSKYVLRVGDQVSYDVTKGGRFTLANEDLPDDAPYQVKPPYTLTEFRALYALLSGNYGNLPVAVAEKAPVIKKFPGPNRPMCPSGRINPK